MTTILNLEPIETFTSYNLAVWPVQPVLWAVAIGVVALALKDVPWRARTISGLLAVLWAWMAISYHWFFLGATHPLGKVFAILFLLQAALLVILGFRYEHMHYRPQGDLLGIAGSFLVACALMLHPVLAIRVGHHYPAFPTFGVPNPTVIFTVGVLLWAKPRAHEALFVIPTMWTIIELPSMMSIAYAQDWLLPIATFTCTGFILWRKQVTRLNRVASLPNNPAFAHMKGEVRRREAEARRDAHATKRATRWSAQPMQPVGK